MNDIEHGAFDARLEALGQVACRRLSAAPDLRASLAGAATRLPALRSRQHLRLAAALTALALALGLAGLAVPGLAKMLGREKVPGLTLRYNLPVPAYLARNWQDLYRGEGVANLFVKKVNAWSEAHDWFGGPQPLAWVELGGGADALPGNHTATPLLANFVVNVYLASKDQTLIDNLNDYLAAPSMGLPVVLPAPLKRSPLSRPAASAQPWEPETIPVTVDGTALNYPQDFSEDEVRMLQANIKLLEVGLPSASYFAALPEHPNFSKGQHLSRIYVVEKDKDQAVSIRNLAPPEKLLELARRLDKDSPFAGRTTSLQRGDSDTAKLERLISAMQASASRQMPQWKSSFGEALVYPLLPAERWEPGHAAAYYELSAADRQATEALYSAYEAVVAEWVAQHPQYRDADPEHDHIYAQASTTETLHPPAPGTIGRRVPSKAPVKLCFELFVSSDNKDELQQLRAGLDAVPGVCQPVTRQTTLTVSAQSEEIMF